MDHDEVLTLGPFRLVDDGEVVEVYVYGEIGGLAVEASDFLGELDRIRSGRPIRFRLNSGGGSVTEAFAIWQVFRPVRDRVTSRCDGLAASMASVLLQLGTRREMAANGWLVIHNPFMRAVGDFRVFEESARTLAAMRDQLAAIYAERSTLDTDQVLEMMDRETWLSADDALDLGLVDEVIAPFAMAARLDVGDLDAFAKVPTGLLRGGDRPVRHLARRARARWLASGL